MKVIGLLAKLVIWCGLPLVLLFNIAMGDQQPAVSTVKMYLHAKQDTSCFLLAIQVGLMALVIYAMIVIATLQKHG